MRAGKPQLTGRETRLQYGENVELILGEGLSEGDEEIVRKKVDDHLESEKKKAEDYPEAKYTLELMFGSGLSLRNPSKGALSFWERGMMGGAADSKLYVCPGKRFKKNDCEAFIPESAGWADGDEYYLTCGDCGFIWKGASVWGEVLARLTMKDWTRVVQYYFVRMGLEADIRVKYHPDDIRSVAAREQEHQLMGSLLTQARVRRAVYTYPMRDIIKETSAGASLHNCILTRLRS